MVFMVVVEGLLICHEFVTVPIIKYPNTKDLQLTVHTDCELVWVLVLCKEYTIYRNLWHYRLCVIW